MEFQKVLALRGPNVWARFPVLEAWVDLGPLSNSASSEIPNFNERLTGWLPSLVEHRCSVGERGGFLERLRRGTYMAHILEHVALELQSLAGTQVGFGRTRQTSVESVYRVAVEYQEEELGRACLDAARELCLAAVHNQPWDVKAEVARLRQLTQRLLPSAGAEAVLQAARQRGIPARRLGEGDLVQLGWGVQQRRVDGWKTDRTGAIAAAIPGDAELTNLLLHSAGVPLAETPDKAVVERVGWKLLLLGNRVVSAVRAAAPGRPAEDATDRVHPEIVARAVDAALAIGLDVAEVQVVADKIDRPLEEQGGYVAAVSAGPGLAAHASRPIAAALVDHLFPPGQKGRIPLVGVTGVNGKTTTTRLIAHLAGQVWHSIGMACTEGVYVDERRIMTGDCTGPQSARAVLDHPDVAAGVLETARGGILRAGLGFDLCDVAVMTNIGDGDHLGISDIHTTEQLAWIKSTLIAAVSPEGMAVLNAADPLAAATSEHCRGSITYFARDEAHPVLRQHRAVKGRTVFVHNDEIILAEGDQETPLISLHQVPLTHGGRVGFHVENVLAATAAAWALNLPLDSIRAGLESFTGGMTQAPARFNLLEVRGATVILDYGHNVSALRRQVEALEQFPHARRTIVYSAAGDRRDCDMVQQGEILGNGFDCVILYEDTYLRGRPEGEISSLFRRGLAAGSRVKDIHEVRGGLKAVEEALSLLRPGDLLVIQPDIIDDTVDYLQGLLANDRNSREIEMDEALVAPALIAEKAPIEGLPSIEVRHGRLGKCVHALEHLPKGRLILSGMGPRSTHRTRHTIQVDVDTHIVPFAPLLFLNHSCEPNCGLLIRRGAEHMELRALRPIEAGEELTLDYATFEEKINFMTGQCQCHSPLCRNTITGYGGIPRDRREFYGPYIAEYLRAADTTGHDER